MTHLDDAGIVDTQPMHTRKNRAKSMTKPKQTGISDTAHSFQLGYIAGQKAEEAKWIAMLDKITNSDEAWKQFQAIRKDILAHADSGKGL